MMDDLVVFIRERLDEDERVANDRGRLRGDTWTAVEVSASRAGGWEVVGTGGTVADGLLEWEARHIADHDPARVLREIEAKRLILHAHREHPMAPEGFCATCGGTQGPCMTKRLLALSYSDHPDYQESWRL